MHAFFIWHQPTRTGLLKLNYVWVETTTVIWRGGCCSNDRCILCIYNKRCTILNESNRSKQTTTKIVHTILFKYCWAFGYTTTANKNGQTDQWQKRDNLLSHRTVIAVYCITFRECLIFYYRKFMVTAQHSLCIFRLIIFFFLFSFFPVTNNQST